MPKYRITFEARAVVYLEVDLEADNEFAAGKLAEELSHSGNPRNFEIAVRELCSPTDTATEAYAEATKLPIKNLRVEPEEYSFEFVKTKKID